MDEYSNAVELLEGNAAELLRKQRGRIVKKATRQNC